MGKLTTHVLDTANGCPAAGMQLSLWRLQDGQYSLLQTLTLNSDGRADAPLLQGDALLPGRYRLVFLVAAYFRALGTELPDPPFLDEVPLDFGLADVAAHYHVPSAGESLELQHLPRQLRPRVCAVSRRARGLHGRCVLHDMAVKGNPDLGPRLKLYTLSPGRRGARGTGTVANSPTAPGARLATQAPHRARCGEGKVPDGTHLVRPAAHSLIRRKAKVC